MRDWYWIVSETGYVLDVAGFGTAPGTPVTLYTLNNQLRPFNQLWRLDGKYIVSKQTGFVLTLKGCPINGSTFVIRPKNPSDKGQIWTYDPNNYTLTSALPFYVATVLNTTINIISNPNALGLKHLENPVHKSQKWIFVKCSGFIEEVNETEFVDRSKI
ncbi:11949_t:CDS:2 [Ambispora leptoticha]|uniref:11949_t:CDS:1 n=1 Tax=Ambispora leptoticha TaxID=144679 RepID=A0A9N9HK26_9GLOM|nr:11949_t:CDS:2 [Ambispora leptoticha]